MNYFQQIFSLLKASGDSIIDDVGEDVLKDIIVDVLCGRNLRDSTEMLTRRRLNLINGATFKMFLEGINKDPSFINSLAINATKEFTAQKSKEQRWLLQWLMGLTGKSFQNVLRDDPTVLYRYAEEYAATHEDTSKTCSQIYGNLLGNLELNDFSVRNVDWRFFIHLFSTIGSQTLTIRGSEKSTYGKLFERLVLGSILEILGFELVSPESLTKFENVFWLSERGTERESDATALLGAGRGVRFDLGFIGRGNPEIALDKVSRFRREIEIGRKSWYMATIVIVDRIGERSRIEQLAKEVDAHIIQMSMSFWPKELAKILDEETGFKHDLLKIPENQIEQYFRKEVQKISLKNFL